MSQKSLVPGHTSTKHQKSSVVLPAPTNWEHAAKSEDLLLIAKIDPNVLVVKIIIIIIIKRDLEMDIILKVGRGGT